MLCACHGEPCYWQKDTRTKAGGWWECRVKRQEHNATRTTSDTRREALTQRRRDLYDSDPIRRISANLKRDRQRRLKTLARRKARLTEED